MPQTEESPLSPPPMCHVSGHHQGQPILSLIDVSNELLPLNPYFCGLSLAYCHLSKDSCLLSLLVFLLSLSPINSNCWLVTGLIVLLKCKSDQLLCATARAGNKMFVMLSVQLTSNQHPFLTQWGYGGEEGPFHLKLMFLQMSSIQSKSRLYHLITLGGCREY